MKAINELGLNAMFIPEAYGGAQMSYVSYLECVRELSKACASTGIVWATNFHAIKPLIAASDAYIDRAEKMTGAIGRQREAAKALADTQKADAIPAMRETTTSIEQATAAFVPFTAALDDVAHYEFSTFSEEIEQAAANADAVRSAPCTAPAAIRSARPPTGGATTGTPQLPASTATKGRPSLRLVISRTSITANASPAGTVPVKCTGRPR